MVLFYSKKRLSFSNKRTALGQGSSTTFQSMVKSATASSQWAVLKLLLFLVVTSTIPHLTQEPQNGQNRHPVFGFLLRGVDAAATCKDKDNKFCATNLHPKSICTEQGICSNPYARGCLINKLMQNSDEKQNETDIVNVESKNEDGHSIPLNVRVCNSNDPPTAAMDGLCQEPLFNYTEVRVHNANWESSIFLSWIMQILLSERLGVPVTIGLVGGNIENSTVSASFYDYDNGFGYSAAAYPFDAMKEANSRPGGDCRLTSNGCVHVMPEVWIGQQNAWLEAMDEGVIDPVEGSGQVGKISLYVPYFTAEFDPTLVSFFGLAGEKNRERLASIFKRPTTWIDYCELVSSTNCSVADDVATRYPDSSEAGLYYEGTNYIGHFRATEENDCTLNPKTCTGHIVAPPCAWSTFIDTQMYWNNISLESSGPLEPNFAYGYGPMIQIWQAANATKSHVMMWWWRPDATIEQFRGGEAEFQQVLLPEATVHCSRARPTNEQRCSANYEERVGLVGANSEIAEQGACDSEAHSLRKVLASSLRSFNEGVPQAERNPAYDAIRNIRVSDLEMDQMLQHWKRIDVDTYGFDAREAVCSWVADNIDLLDSAIPLGYPRILNDEGLYSHKWYLVVAMIVGVVAFIFVLTTSGFVYIRRKTKVFVYAQVQFIFLILFGLCLVATAAVIYPVEPSTFACVSREWLVVLGYTCELVPLLVKISAINAILQSAKKMKRVQISPKLMYAKVASLTLLVVIYLIVWTTVDPPTKVEERLLAGSGDEHEQHVDISLSCQPEGLQFWWSVPLGFQGILLLCATVLAFQSRNVMQDFNESRSLGMMVYSHFLFLILRTIAYFFEKSGQFKPNVMVGAISILLSLDVLSAICIYIVPKCLAAQEDKAEYTRNAGVVSSYEVSNIEANANRATSEWRMSMANINISGFESESDIYARPDSFRRTSFRHEPIKMEPLKMGDSRSRPGFGRALSCSSDESMGLDMPLEKISEGNYITSGVSEGTDGNNQSCSSISHQVASHGSMNGLGFRPRRSIDEASSRTSKQSGSDDQNGDDTSPTWAMKDDSRSSGCDIVENEEEKISPPTRTSSSDLAVAI